MNLKKIFRYIAGYILGLTVFAFLIPVIIYTVYYLFNLIFQTAIFSDDIPRLVISSVFFIPGIFFVLWSNAALFFIGKGGPAEGFGVAISPKTQVLVAMGPYRYTRNPMVFGAYISYLAFSIYLNSYASLAVVVLFFPVILCYLKKSEEKRLLKDFGEDFLRYREKVSLLIPLPPKK